MGDCMLHITSIIKKFCLKAGTFMHHHLAVSILKPEIFSYSTDLTEHQ